MWFFGPGLMWLRFWHPELVKLQLWKMGSLKPDSSISCQCWRSHSRQLVNQTLHQMHGRLLGYITPRYSRSWTTATPIGSTCMISGVGRRCHMNLWRRMRRQHQSSGFRSRVVRMVLGLGLVKVAWARPKRISRKDCALHGTSVRPGASVTGR